MKIILQQDNKDCGVICLQYVIEHYHGFVPIGILREDLCLSNQGTTAYHLVETLKKYHFESCGKKINYENLQTCILPAVVHLILSNGLLHFAVLTKWHKDYVILMDPAVGKRKMSKSQFEDIWDGVVILAIPLDEIPKFTKVNSLAKIVRKIYQKEKKWLFAIAFCLFGITCLNILTSFLSKIILENFQLFLRKETYLLLGILSFVTFLKIGFEYFKIDFKRYLNKNLVMHFLYAFLNHLFQLPKEKLLSFHQGEIHSRFQEILEIKELFLDVGVTSIFNLFFSMMILLVLFYLNFDLTVCLLIGVGIGSILYFLISKPFYQVILDTLENEKNLQLIYRDHLDMFPTMKHLNQSKFQIEKLENQLCEYNHQNFLYQKKLNWFSWIRTSFVELLLLFLNFYGITLLLKQELTILEFITFQSLYLYFIEPWQEFLNIGPKWFYMKGIINKLNPLLEIKEETVEDNQKVLVNTIEFQNVSFSYNQIYYPIKNLNFCIHAPEHIFLSGKSGIGKSTISQLLIRERENYKGNILMNQKNSKDFSLSEIKSMFAYLSQDETVIRGTIKENIMLNSQNEQRFDLVCKICLLETIVNKRALRYDSMIFESNLSGGELQRIKLARVLMKEASCYIFDEALSEVDEKTEVIIIKKLREFLKENTLIYISHRNHQELFERSIELEKCME